MVEASPGKGNPDRLVVCDDPWFRVEGDLQAPLQIAIPDMQALYNIAVDQPQAFISHPTEDGNAALYNSILDINFFDDNLLQYERSDIEGSNFDVPRFSFETTLKLSGERKAESDHGYYGINRVQRIRQILARKDVGSDLIQNTRYQNSLRIQAYKTLTTVSLGYDSREVEEVMLAGNVAEETGWWRNEESYASRRLKEGTTNDEITIELNSLQPDVLIESDLKLKSYEQFSRDVDVYSNVVQKVILSLYEEAQLPAPEKSILWAPLLKMISERSARGEPAFPGHL